MEAYILEEVPQQRSRFHLVGGKLFESYNGMLQLRELDMTFPSTHANTIRARDLRLKRDPHFGLGPRFNAL
jgi:hypothetical protein